ncbi:MAG: bifunctional metallophosphatase/5'-nucleotidase [Prevotella sp.]|nr:bifunctional metallophosphatase/5'-nucleotidase [Prevotella sp.]
MTIYNKVRKSLLLTGAVVLVSLLGVVPSEAKSRKEAQLVILHTNDCHSAIMPLHNTTDTLVRDRAGFLRRVALVNEERAKDPDLLYFDSGDFSQGSTYYTMFRGDVEVQLMNRMGCDAATIGNHEFDYGLENMARLFRMANFPIVCSNYDCTGTVLEGLVKPYIILHRKGVKIGVFALSPAMKGLVSDANCEGVRYLDPATTGQHYIDLLRKKEKCDIVICLSHLGWKVSDYPDEKFISLTEGCDLVLGGHTHTFMPSLEYAPDKNGKLIPVDQNGKSGAFVGRLVLNLKKGR